MTSKWAEEAETRAPVDPLAGLRVLAVADNLAACLAAHFFADGGADVVHIERPDGVGARSLPSYRLLGRGARSVVLDLATEEGRSRAFGLVAESDVLIETFRPATAMSRHFDDNVLRQGNPRLVHLSITGWGRDNPYATLKGYEHLVLAKLGVLHEFSRIASRPGPAYVSIPYASFGAAYTGVIGVLAALYERDSSGLGQHIEADLIRGFASLDTWAWWFQVLCDRYPDAFTPTALFDDANRPAGPFAFQNLLAPTSDYRWLLFGLNLPHMLKAAIREMGLSDRLQEPELKGFPQVDDPDLRNEMWRAMFEAVGDRSMGEWQQIFDHEHDLFGEEARSGAEVLDHPQFQQSDMTVVCGGRGGGRQPGPIVRYRRYPRTSYPPPPELGADDALAPTAAQPRDASAPTRSPVIPGELPLQGVTVLEFGALFAGPYSATLLADLGARVIKVEPLSGDPIRGMLGFPELGGAKVMQGKESIALDATTEEGQRLIEELISRADIVLQSFRPDAAERMGVDADRCAAINPEVVYLTAGAYGADGPMANRPAFATTIGAAVGFVKVNGGPTREVGPCTPLDEQCDISIRLSTAGCQMNAQADGVSALGNAAAMLLGLVARQRGRPVPPMATSMLGTSVYAIADHLWPDSPEVTADEALFGLGPLYRLYECSTGWVFLAAPKEHEWESLTRALHGQIDLAGDERFGDAQSRHAHAAELASVLQSIFSTAAAPEWEALLTEFGVGCVEVDERTPESRLMSDEFGRACDLVVEVVHPTFDASPRLRPPAGFSRSATQSLPGVLCGQHTDRILAELGYSDDQIAVLRVGKIIG